MIEIKNYENKVWVFDNILPEKDVASLVTFFINFIPDGLPPEYFSFSCAHLNKQAALNLPGYETYLDSVTPIAEQINEMVISLLNKNVSVKPWELTTTNFIKRMEPKSKADIAPGTDNPGGIYIHIDNQDYIDRTIYWSYVYYPNDNYEGGEIYYPEYEYAYKPKKNSLVLHTGTTLHGVKPFTNGSRYSVGTFITIKGA